MVDLVRDQPAVPFPYRGFWNQDPEFVEHFRSNTISFAKLMSVDTYSMRENL
jgi:hypothetical protein